MEGPGRSTPENTVVRTGLAVPECVCWNSRGEGGHVTTSLLSRKETPGDQPSPQIALRQKRVDRKETQKGHWVTAGSSAWDRWANPAYNQHYLGYVLQKEQVIFSSTLTSYWLYYQITAWETPKRYSPPIPGDM